MQRNIGLGLAYGTSQVSATRRAIADRYFDRNGPVELWLNLFRSEQNKRVTQKRNPLYLNDILVGLPGVEPGTNGL
jgi:hypothetical protein